MWCCFSATETAVSRLRRTRVRTSHIHRIWRPMSYGELWTAGAPHRPDLRRRRGGLCAAPHDHDSCTTPALSHGSGASARATVSHRARQQKLVSCNIVTSTFTCGWTSWNNSQVTRDFWELDNLPTYCNVINKVSPHKKTTSSSMWQQVSKALFVWASTSAFRV
jgi:hypothetical protein